MCRARFVLTLAILLAGCRSYVNSTPSRLVEGDHAANYGQIFRQPIPTDVTIINSAVITYSFRPGVVTTADFKFERIAPRSWIERTAKRFYLSISNSEFVQREIYARREHAQPWYAPKPLEHYDLYREATSVGYVHMLVEKTPQPDGRRPVFISKY